MKPEYVSYLVESISEIFSAMLNSEATSNSMLVTTSEKATLPMISAHICFVGMAEGVVTLSFPVMTATRVARALTGAVGKIPHEMLVDCVMELVGILAARSTFRDLASSPVRVGVPSSESEMSESTDTSLLCDLLEIPFESKMGAFSLHIALVPVKQSSPAERCAK